MVPFARKLIGLYVEADPEAKREIEAFFDERVPERLERMKRGWDSN